MVIGGMAHQFIGAHYFYTSFEHQNSSSTHYPFQTRFNFLKN
jgi:hypothetical protein